MQHFFWIYFIQRTCMQTCQHVHKSEGGGGRKGGGGGGLVGKIGRVLHVLRRCAAFNTSSYEILKSTYTTYVTNFPLHGGRRTSNQCQK